MRTGEFLVVGPMRAAAEESEIVVVLAEEMRIVVECEPHEHVELAGLAGLLLVEPLLVELAELV